MRTGNNADVLPMGTLAGDGGQLPAAPAPQLPATVDARQMAEAMMQVLGAMQQISNSVAAMGQNVQTLMRRLDMAERLTPGQAQELGKAIRRRVTELLAAYGILHSAGHERAARRVDALIRRELRNSVGAEGRSLRDLPRCEYAVYLERVQLWNDYDRMMEVAQDA